MNKTFLAVVIASLLTSVPVFSAEHANNEAAIDNDLGVRAGESIKAIPPMLMGYGSDRLTVNTSQAMSEFIKDPERFLSEHTVDVIELIKNGILPGHGYARLAATSTGYQFHLSPTAGVDTAPAYFLGFNGRTNTSPAYVDIPKAALEGSFLLTGSLTGCSVIVTDLNATHYRVYHDGRGGSSVLYDNVVMSVDYSDYQGVGVGDYVAASYLLFKGGRWQMMLQRQSQHVVPGDLGELRWLKRDGAEGVAIIQTPERVSNSLREAKFAAMRRGDQDQLLKRAAELNIDVLPRPEDRPIDPNEPMNVAENSALTQWQDLREQINRGIARELAPAFARRDTVYDLLKTASGELKTRYQAEIRAIRVTEAFYRNKYQPDITASIDSDRMWLWLDKKQREGTQAVIAIDSDLAGGADLRLVERYTNYQTVLKNLTGERQQKYQQGLADSGEVDIPDWRVDMTTSEMMELLLDTSKSLNFKHKGALISRIKENYKRDLYRNALDKTQKVATYIQAKGGEVAQLMPQAFILLAKPGRCLPLSRMMASAIANKGGEGIRDFAANLYAAAADPESTTSRAVYETIGYLHGNDEAMSAETKLGNRRIQQITADLQAEHLGTNGSIFMLMNTKVHTMLVGKTTTAKQDKYYFYDPNFAVFTFDNAKSLAKGLSEHLVKQSYAHLYSAYGEDKRSPEFEMRRIDTEKMVKIRLSNGLYVSDIISPEDRVLNVSIDQTAAAVAQTTDSLQADLKLKSALTLLESVNMAEDFFTATQQLFQREGLDHNWLPVFENITDNADGSYTIPVINSLDTEQVRELITRDERIWQFKRHYEHALESIKTRYTYANGELLPRHGVAEVEHVDGLNSAFAVQSIISWFQNKSRSSVAGQHLPQGLSQALRVHTYVNLTQIAHGTVLDASKIVKLYRVAISEGEAVTGSTLSAVSHTVNEGVSIGLGFINVVLDSYELAHAQNEVQKAVYGTQLVFDSASLVTSAAGIGAGLIGASTAGAFLGGAGVIAGGLAVGFTALAQAFGEVADDAKAVGQIFADIDSAYQSGGYVRVDKVLDDGENYHGIEPKDGAVIIELDLQANRLRFDSQYIYRTHHGSTGSGKINYFFWAGDMPTQVRDKSQAINVREGIGYSDTASFDAQDRILVLPATPKSYISYQYQNLPGATTRHDAGFDVLRRLEQDKRFDYDFYTFPSEYIIRTTTQEFVHTNIAVILDEQDRQIYMRKLDDELNGKLHYQFTGFKGEYHIVLQPGASLSLAVSSRKARGTTWVLDARHLDSQHIRVQRDHISVGGVRVSLSSLQTGAILVLNKHNEVFYIDMEQQAAILTVEDASTWDSNQALQAHLASLATKQQLSGQFVAVQNYHPDAGQDSVGQAFYQVSEDRFIFTNNSANHDFLNQAKLVSIKQDRAWFSHQAALWQVDIATGKVLKQYRALGFDSGAIASSRAWQEAEHLYFSIEQKRDNGQLVAWTYRVEEDRLLLISVQGDTELMSAAGNPNLANYPDVAELFSTGEHWLIPEHDLDPEVWIDAELDRAITLSGRVDGINKRYWILPGHVGLQGVIEANLGQALPDDLILAFVTQVSSSSDKAFYFYSHSEQNLYFQTDNGLEGTRANRVDIDSLKSVFTNNQQLFALQQGGSLLLLDNSGQARLAGVSADWLKTHRSSLVPSLTLLTGQHELTLENLVLLGLSHSNKKTVNVWFDVKKRRMVVAGRNLDGHNLSYLGLSLDEQDAWIYDLSEQVLYKQALETQGSSLAPNEDLLVSLDISDAVLYQPLGQDISLAVRQGNYLHLTTTEGLVFRLATSASVLDESILIAVTSAWKERNKADLRGGLAFLAYPMVTAVKIQGQAHQAPAWYLSQSKQVIGSSVLNASHYLEYLGKDHADTDAYFIHDATTKQLLRVKGDTSDVLGYYELAQLEEGSVLVLQADKTHRNERLTLPLIKGVTSVMISGATEDQTYVLAEKELAYYRQVVVDVHGRNSSLRLALSDADSLLLQRRDDDLVLYDADSDTGIVIRKIEEASERKFKLITKEKTVYFHQILAELNNEQLVDDQVIHWGGLLGKINP